MHKDIDSSFIQSLDYDNNELIITFTNGKRFKYANVPQGTVNDLVNAPSTGTAFHRYIKRQFSYEELTD